MRDAKTGEGRRQRVKAIRREIEAGRASGEPVAFDADAIKRRGREVLSGGAVRGKTGRRAKRRRP